MTIKPDEFYKYRQTVNASEAFAKSILVKPDGEIVELVNRISGQYLKKNDYTGDVEFTHYGLGQHHLVFKVNFILVKKEKSKGYPQSIDLILATKFDGNWKDISEKKSVDFQEMTITSIIPPNSLKFVYQGETFNIFSQTFLNT